MKTLIMTFARCSGFSLAHENLFNSMFMHKKLFGDSEVKIYLSPKCDTTKNPLQYKDKIKLAKEIFENHKESFIDDPNLKSILDVLKYNSDPNVNLVLFCGQDRYSEFTRIAENYNKKEFEFAKIDVIIGNNRNSDNIENSISATQLRNFAKDSDYESFKKYVPKITTEITTKYMYDLLRTGMNING